MTSPTSAISRRRFVGASAGIAVAAAAPGAGLAALFKPTPRQPLGPFYMPLRPLSVDNDLVLAPGRAKPADGRIIHVLGRVLDPGGRPIQGARVEIWQANSYGHYNHPNDRNTGLRPDANFQGSGHDLTDADGGYRFRTVKPGAYPNDATWTRPPHIHFAVFPRGSRRWVTQLYFAGEEFNRADRLLNQVPAAERHRLIMDLAPAPAGFDPKSEIGTFDIVLNTPGVERKPT